MAVLSVGDVLSIMDGLDVPTAHLMWGDHKPPPLPYAVIVPHESRSAYADGHVLHRARRYDIELYSRLRDVPLELRVQRALDEAECAYTSDVVVDEGNHFVLTYFSTTLTEEA